jgi:hypothetical protein
MAGGKGFVDIPSDLQNGVEVPGLEEMQVNIFAA